MILRHYGAPAFDPALFRPIKNALWVKPQGGLWTSPLTSKHSWYRWCRTEGFKWKELNTWFDLRLVGRWITINGHHDLQQLPWHYRGQFSSGPDFEEILRQGFDAIHLTEIGEWRTRNPLHRRHLLSWDCESVLILNPAAIRPIPHEQIPILRAIKASAAEQEVHQPDGQACVPVHVPASRNTTGDPGPGPAAAVHAR